MSEKIGQKAAVVKAVSEVLNNSFTPFETVVNDVVTSEQKTEVRNKIFNGILEGYITYHQNTSDEQALRNYVSGMVSNYFRKAKELNGNTSYSIKNPGSGRGRNDSQLSALRKLLTKYEPGTDQFVKIEGAISERETTLHAERTDANSARKASKKLKNIDFDVLPKELSDLANV